MNEWSVVGAALIAANALFVAAEFALIASSRLAFEQRAASGDRLARIVLAVLASPVSQDRYVATAQLGITFASLGLGMYGEHVLATWLGEKLTELGGARIVAAHAVASVAAVAFLTFLHIVLGEMVPKTLGLTYAEATARNITRPMLVMRTRSARRSTTHQP